MRKLITYSLILSIALVLWACGTASESEATASMEYAKEAVAMDEVATEEATEEELAEDVTTVFIDTNAQQYDHASQIITEHFEYVNLLLSDELDEELQTEISTLIVSNFENGNVTIPPFGNLKKESIEIWCSKIRSSNIEEINITKIKVLTSNKEDCEACLRLLVRGNLFVDGKKERFKQKFNFQKTAITKQFGEETEVVQELKIISNWSF